MKTNSKMKMRATMKTQVKIKTLTLLTATLLLFGCVDRKHEAISEKCRADWQPLKTRVLNYTCEVEIDEDVFLPEDEVKQFIGNRDDILSDGDLRKEFLIK